MLTSPPPLPNTDLPPPVPTAAVPLRYSGTAEGLFPLALKCSLLTVLTLGIYRFWAKTHLRRYVWSNLTLAGDGLEYTGTGREKFLGFLVAVVVLALYLAVVQLALFAFGLGFTLDPESDSQQAVQALSYLLMALASVPLWLIAAYRSRRYKMARTRLRGIRFGMGDGAVGYALRAMLYFTLAMVSLGVLLPLATFRLEKYCADRSFYGTARFAQEGHFSGLYPALRVYLWGLGIAVGGVVLVAGGSPVLGWMAIVGGAVTGLVGLAIYPIRAFCYLTQNTRLRVAPGQEVSFGAVLRAGQVLWTYIGGVVLTSLAAGMASSVIIGAVFVVLAPEMVRENHSAFFAAEAVLAVVAGYLLIIAAYQAVGLVFVTQPVLALFLRAITVGNPAALEAVAQAPADPRAGAEGIAEALDIGGAF